jgi:hypothetical protein
MEIYGNSTTTTTTYSSMFDYELEQNYENHLVTLRSDQQKLDHHHEDGAIAADQIDQSTLVNNYHQQHNYVDLNPVEVNTDLWAQQQCYQLHSDTQHQLPTSPDSLSSNLSTPNSGEF